MRAMVLEAGKKLLQLDERRVCAEPLMGQVLIKVHACGVCRTDLHIVDGELSSPKLPLVPGHEIIGVVEAVGDCVEHPKVGDHVGVAWLGWTCGKCEYCLSGRENLCDLAKFTGYHIDGGYAEFVVADARYCFVLPELFQDASAAPLMCAGPIGYRALRMARDAKCLGLYGFGAAAHITIQVARHRGQEVFAFTKPGDEASQAFARSLGATWAGGSDDAPPMEMDAALIFAPVGGLVPLALTHTKKGGAVVCAGIHMSDIPAFPYTLLWGERSVRSVANLTRQDGEEFLAIAQKAAIQTTTVTFPLHEANQALDQLRAGNIEGAAVLLPEPV